MCFDWVDLLSVVAFLVGFVIGTRLAAWLLPAPTNPRKNEAA